MKLEHQRSLFLTAQLAELKPPPKLEYTRAIEYATELLAKFGMFVRDMADIVESIFMDLLMKHAREKLSHVVSGSIVPSISTICKHEWARTVFP